MWTENTGYMSIWMNLRFGNVQGLQRVGPVFERLDAVHVAVAGTAAVVVAGAGAAGCVGRVGRAGATYG